VLAESPDPQIAAHEAGLRYLDARGPGITRRKRGRHFAYVDAAGKPVRDEAVLRRIRALAVPPAYTDVWISPIANGHLQATGRDARGRKQYRYHKRFREVRDEAKYHRLVAFGRALPAVRKAVAKDLGGTELSRRKVLAALVSLLDLTGIRVGNEEYATANDSFGLTTLRTRHVRLDGSQVRLHFRGKTGKEQRILLNGARLARIIKRCRDLPGEELFTYLDESGSANSVSSEDVNEYLREIAGGDFSAKDFRTWIGTVECIGALAEPAADPVEAKKKHRCRTRARRGPPRQHAGDMPQGVRAPGGTRNLRGAVPAAVNRRARRSEASAKCVVASGTLRFALRSRMGTKE
jgi:DNA topoisomerase-1